MFTWFRKHIPHRKKKSHRTRLTMECLENRDCPAAPVITSFTATNLGNHVVSLAGVVQANHPAGVVLNFSNAQGLLGTTQVNADGTFHVNEAVPYLSDIFAQGLNEETLYSGIAEAILTNQAPVAYPKSYSILHDHTLTTAANYPYYNGALSGVYDMDGDPLSASAINGTALVNGTAIITLASGAQVTMNADGAFTYTPAAGYTTGTNPDSFTYTISDGIATATNTVTINVTNQVPYVYPKNYSILHDHSLTTSANYPYYNGALCGVYDMDGDPLTVSAINGTALVNSTATITLASGAQVTMNADGAFIYTPAAGYTTGTNPDSFTYTISDGIATATTTVTINVTNQAPYVYPKNYSILHDHSLTTSANYPYYNGALSGIYDMDGDTLTVSAINGTTLANGTANITLVSGAHVTMNGDGTFTYTPAAGYTTGTNPDSFTYSISDGIAKATNTVTITVTNQAPYVYPKNYSILHDHTLTTSANYPYYNGALSGVYDMDGDALTITAINGTTLVNGTATITLASGAHVTMNADGAFTYTPAVGYTTGTNPDSFTYTISDGIATATNTVTINVTNQAPTAYPQNYSILHDHTLITSASYPYYNGALSGVYDMDGDTLTVAAINGTPLTNGVATITLASGAQVAMNADGAFTYTPPAGFSTGANPDSFTYTISDGNATTTNLVSVNIAAPTTTLTIVSVTQGANRNVTVVGSASGANVGNLTVNLTGVVNGQTTTAPNGSFSFTGVASGPGTIQVTTTDAQSNISDPVSATLSNTAPVINNLEVIPIQQGNTYEILGRVVDEYAIGLRVRLTGLHALGLGVYVTTDCAGCFCFQFTVTRDADGNILDEGNLTANTTDWFSVAAQAVSYLFLP